MMRYFAVLLSLMSLLSACVSHPSVTITWQEDGVTSSLAKGERTFLLETDKAGNVVLECVLPAQEKPVIILRGKAKGSFTYKGEHETTIILDGLTLSAKAGKTPLSIKNTRTTTLLLRQVNRLHDGAPLSDKVSAKDCLRCKGDLVLTGDGELQLKASHTGSKGMKCKGNFTMLSGTLRITTTGSYLRAETVQMPPHGARPPFPQGDFDSLANVPFLPDGMPMMPPPPEGMPTMPPPFEQNYHGTCKGAKIMGTALIEGGTLDISTRSGGAEGFEAKKGITIAGGKIHIEAYDDGINTNGRILVTGGDIYVKSLHNDGIDTNYGKEGGYVQHAGRVEVVSEAGPPEESLDTDWTPIIHDGGELIATPELQKEPFGGNHP